MGVIGILYGESGTGKSFNALCFEEPILCMDMERRLEKKIKKYFPEKAITLRNLALYTKDFKEDEVGSFDEFVKEVDKLLKLPEDDYPKTIIVDGIGDLRKYANAKWLTYAKTRDGKPRKQAQNSGDFAEINDLVRNALFPLVNWGRVNDINIIFTSTMTDNYQKIKKLNGDEESVKDGRIASHKDWCNYRLDFLVEMWTPKNKQGKVIPEQYMMTCTKSEVGSFEEDISGKNLYDVFIERGLIS